MGEGLEDALMGLARQLAVAGFAEGGSGARRRFPQEPVETGTGHQQQPMWSRAGLGPQQINYPAWQRDSRKKC